LSFNYWGKSLTDIHQTLMMTLYDDFDYESAPRGKPIRELIGASFTLENPRDRIIASPVRNVNYGFAVGELCWYLRGATDLETMLYYNKRMAQFSDDGKTINSAYGSRMFRERWTAKPPMPGSYGSSQLTNVLDELKRDPDSRRAIMHINEPSDLLKAVESGSKDVPCTLSIQLLFSFTCLQEVFLGMLQKEGVPVDDLGAYHHHAGSLHIYDTHFEMAKQVSEEPDFVTYPMKPINVDDLRELAEVHEYDIRVNGAEQFSWLGDGPGEVDWMIEKLIQHRKKRDGERRKELDKLIEMTEEAGGYPELKEKDEQQQT
jgi:thymidylate synthase